MGRGVRVGERREGMKEDVKREFGRCEMIYNTLLSSHAIYITSWA